VSRPTPRARSTAAAAAVVLLLSAAHAAGLSSALLPALPLLALMVSLLFGVYPGCETVVRVAEGIAARSRSRPAAAPSSSRPRPVRARGAHGGLLLALSLSGRAPPA
jgi:hypothetical protein